MYLFLIAALIWKFQLLFRKIPGTQKGQFQLRDLMILVTLTVFPLKIIIIVNCCNFHKLIILCSQTTNKKSPVSVVCFFKTRGLLENCYAYKALPIWFTPFLYIEEKNIHRNCFLNCIFTINCFKAIIFRIKGIPIVAIQGLMKL